MKNCILSILCLQLMIHSYSFFSYQLMSNTNSDSSQNRPDYRRPTLKIQQDKGTLTIQTEQLAIQAIFNTPILQVADYLEQFEKYSFRAALSGLNLKVDEYDAQYTKAKDKIQETYNTLTYKSMSMIQDILITLRLIKIQMWKEQASIANGLKTHLFQKILDPYDFNPSQFEHDISSVCEMLKCPNSAESFIEKLSLSLKQHESMKMQQMFSGKVCHPFLAQNKDHNEVNTSSLYTSLLNQIKIKMEKFDESLAKRHCTIQEEIVKFMQFSTQHSLKAQKIAHSLIKKYNEYPNTEANEFLLHSIIPTIKINEKRQTVDADQLFSNKQYRSQLRPAFANRVQNIEFKTTCKLFDPETNNESEVEFIEPEENHREWDRYGGIQSHIPRSSPFDVFSERRRNNPKEFYQLREFQKQKYREEEMRLRERERNQRQKQRERQKVVAKKIVRVMSVPPPWTEYAEHDNPFLYFYFTSKQKEFNLWDIKNKALEREYSTYTSKKDKNYHIPLFRTAEEKAKFETEMKNEAEYLSNQRQEASINFQIKRREEQSIRLVKLHKIMQGRTYQKFMAMNKIDMRSPPFCNSHTISRYGITFNINFDRSKDSKQIDKFFYLYFKERYYKENESIRQNTDNPIIYLDSSKISMESSAKIVSQYINSIVKRAESLPFFLVWGEDLLNYRLKVNRDSKTAYFDFYSFVSPSNAQKLMYELRRRLRFSIKEQVKEEYCGGSEMERIYSKVQVAHRFIFDRHRQMPDLTSSILKGRQLVNEIFDSLQNC